MTTASYSVKIKGQNVTFQSSLSQSEVYDILSTLTSTFARDLYFKWTRNPRKWNNLSENQYAWAVKLAQDSVNERQRQAEQDYDFNGIVNAIDSAKNRGLKRIKLRFWDVIIKPSKYPEKLYVLSATQKVQGDYGYQPKYLGWITRNATSLRDEELIHLLEDVAQDPSKAAKLHGMETGSCACCGRELTNRASIQLGIGPICAEKYGLI